MKIWISKGYSSVFLPKFIRSFFTFNIIPTFIPKIAIKTLIKVNTPGNSAKILVVDDEPNIVLALEFLLQREGYQVEKAFNGLQAIEVAENFQPDIVVLDVMMPGMDGFEVARKMRSNPALEYAKIVFLTAKGTQRDKQSGYDSGAEYYMIKPFDNDAFVNAINEIMAYG